MRMRFACPTVLLFASVALAQTPVVPNMQQVTPLHTKRSAAPAGPSLAPTTPVITIDGVCDNASTQLKAHTVAAKAEAKPCKTVITREEFDALAEAIQPHMSAAGKSQLASFYPKLLIMQHEFRKRGMANDPTVKRALAFANLRSEAEETAKVLKSMSEEAPSAEAIEKYYQENSSVFEQAELLRIIIPEDKSASAQKQEAPGTAQAATSTPTGDAYKQKVDSLQARAAAGEDFDNLQAEAYKSAGIVGAQTKTNMGSIAVTDLPMNHRQVMSLKAGEVSQALPGPYGTYIYKVVSKSARPLNEVRSEIHAKLADQIFTQSMRSIDLSAKIELNRTYFPMGATTAAQGENTGLLGAKGFATKGATGRGSRGGARTTIPPRVTVPTPQTTSPAPSAPVS
jgi:hypothetical protein